MQNKIIMEYYKTEEGKLVHYLIHEHNNGMSIIGVNLRLLELRIEKGLDLKLDEIINAIKNGMKKSSDGVDYLYTKLKEKHDGIN